MPPRLLALLELGQLFQRQSVAREKAKPRVLAVEDERVLIHFGQIGTTAAELSPHRHESRVIVADDLLAILVIRMELDKVPLLLPPRSLGFLGSGVRVIMQAFPLNR